MKIGAGRASGMTMYRPKGWGVPLEISPLGSAKCYKIDKFSFEAGADAMLEGLKKDTTKYSLKLAQFPDSMKGWLVFIPEEKE